MVNLDAVSTPILDTFARCLTHDVRISMDGRGRALDNIFVERLWRTVKYEDVYIKGYGRVLELMIGLTAYFEFYNMVPRKTLPFRLYMI